MSTNNGYITPEADAVAKLLDGMDTDSRQAILDLTRHFAQLDHESRIMDYTFAKILARNIDRLPPDEQRRVRLMLAQIRTPRGGAENGFGAA